RAGPVRRGHGDEAVARHPQEPEAAEAAAALPRRPGEALLQARPRAPGAAVRPRARRLVLGDERIGEVYLGADEIAARVAELGAEIAADYEGREPLLVGSL